MNNPLVTPDPGLFIWTILTFLVLLALLREVRLEAAARRARRSVSRRSRRRSTTRSKAREELERVQQESVHAAERGAAWRPRRSSRARERRERFREEMRQKAIADAASIVQERGEADPAREDRARDRADPPRDGRSVGRDRVEAAPPQRHEGRQPRADRRDDQADSADGVGARASAGAGTGMTGRPSWGIDALLVLMVVIWGANYSVIKRAFAEIPPQPFNALRMVDRRRRRSTLAIRGRAAGARVRRAAVVGVLHVGAAHDARSRRPRCGSAWSGHLAYQMLLCRRRGGDQRLERRAHHRRDARRDRDDLGARSAASASRRLHWIGVAVVAASASTSSSGTARRSAAPRWKGDLLMMVSVACWVAYTLGASRLIARHSPLYVTGMTMIDRRDSVRAARRCRRFFDVDWAVVSPWTWVALVLSALARAVSVVPDLVHGACSGSDRPGRRSTRTSSPSSRWRSRRLWLGEPITAAKIARPHWRQRRAADAGSLSATRRGAGRSTRRRKHTG